MQLRGYVDRLQEDLEGLAGLGDDTVAEAARRLSTAIRGFAGLRLLDALSEAALEISAQLPSGHVEVRLSGQDPSLVYVEEPEDTAAPPAGDDTMSARITLRLPDALKSTIDTAAAREGVSVNTWVVRALTRAVSPSAIPGVRRGPGNRLTGFGRS
jgi:hypothetical protein